MNLDTFIDPDFTPTQRETMTKLMPYDFGGIVPGVEILPASKYPYERQNRPNIAAVDRRRPNTMYINSLHMFDVLAHEMEHVFQNRTGKRYDSSYDQEVIKLYPKDKLRANLIKSGSDKELYNHLVRKYAANPASYLGDLDPGEFSLREQFAGLSGLEQSLKVDLTKDPVIRKRFFNDDQQMIDTYKATTGLRQDRLDAKDLPPMTIPVPRLPPKPRSWADDVLDKFRK